MKHLIFVTMLLVGFYSQAQQSRPEAVRGFIPRPSAVFVEVYSGGCTYKSDFRHETTNVGERKSVVFFRTREDECLAFFPTGVTLSFSYEELGLNSGDHFKIVNPITDSVVW